VYAVRNFIPNLFVRASRQVTMPSHRFASRRFVASIFAALGLTFVFVAPRAFAQSSVTSNPPATFTLSNGLKVVVIPDHRTPVVTQMIWYKVGSADETSGKSGLAHFLEHLMFKGTSKHPAGEFSKTVLRIGGNENAFTSTDYTGYFQRVPRDQLGTMMGFEADRMTGLILQDENVLPERDVVLEEYNMRVANNPEARLTEQIMAALYLNHPYGRPVIGWRQEIEKLDREDALAFYKRFYAPNNATLVIAGDVDAKEVRSMAERTFGEVAPQPAIPVKRIRPQEPTPAASRTVTLSDPRVEQPGIRRYYLVPSAATAAAGESPALDVLAQLMGGGSNSYLYRALVVDRPLAVSASAGYQGTSLDATQFMISVSPKPGVEFAQIEQVIDGVISDVGQNAVRAEDLERVKTQLIAEAIYAQDNQATLARWYGGALTTGLSIEDIRSWPDRIRAVTAEQVRDAAQKWLDKKRSVTGYLIKDAAPKREEPKREEKRS
jgi:zinc protease